jgi:post-segregation antitoxin (ccd killing protein)
MAGKGSETEVQVANLTITVDDEILKRARIRALEQGTSVSAVLAERLRAFAREGETQGQVASGLIRLARENTAGGGKALPREARQGDRVHLR